MFGVSHSEQWECACTFSEKSRLFQDLERTNHTIHQLKKNERTFSNVKGLAPKSIAKGVQPRNERTFSNVKGLNLKSETQRVQPKCRKHGGTYTSTPMQLRKHGVIHHSKPSKHYSLIQSERDKEKGQGDHGTFKPKELQLSPNVIELVSDSPKGLHQVSFVSPVAPVSHSSKRKRYPVLRHDQGKRQNCMLILKDDRIKVRKTKKIGRKTEKLFAITYDQIQKVQKSPKFVKHKHSNRYAFRIVYVVDLGDRRIMKESSFSVETEHDRHEILQEILVRKNRVSRTRLK